MNGRLALFQEFLKHPLQIGSVISSSRFLECRIVGNAGIGSAETIVELGPGTGGTTRAILQAMAPRAKLLSIEINPHLHALVSRIKDGRLIAHRGEANGLKDILSMHGLSAPEVLISGIPFSTMSRRSGSQILETISSVLAPGGRFVAYQVSKRVACLCRPILGPGQMEVELFNIPPLRVYRWEKNHAENCA
jgi:phospholipid N-methyltransferase